MSHLLKKVKITLDFLVFICYPERIITKKGIYIMTNKSNADLIAELHNACDSLLAETNKKMTKLIEDFNEKNEDRNIECDTVDLDSKFDVLSDYVEDYTNEFEEVEIN